MEDIHWGRVFAATAGGIFIAIAYALLFGLKRLMIYVFHKVRSRRVAATQAQVNAVIKRRE